MCFEPEYYRVRAVYLSPSYKLKLSPEWVLKKDHQNVLHFIDNEQHFVQTENQFIIAPRLNNLHLHLGESLFKGVFHKTTLDNYLEFTENWNAYLGDLKQEAWSASARYTLTESSNLGVKNICTTRGIELLKDYPLHAMVGYPIMNSKKLAHYLDSLHERLHEFINKSKSYGLQPGISIHSLYSIDQEILSQVNQIYNDPAFDLKFLTLHVAETEESIKRVHKKYSRSEIEILEKWNLLHHNTYLVHCSFLHEQDFQIIAKNKAKIIICPISNCNLDSKICNIYRLDEQNIEWSVATDGIATGENLDPIAQVEFLHRKFPAYPYERLLYKIFDQSSPLMTPQILDKEVLHQLLCKGDYIMFSKTDMDHQCNDFSQVVSSQLKRQIFVQGVLLDIPAMSIPEKFLPKMSFK